MYRKWEFFYIGFFYFGTPFNKYYLCSSEKVNFNNSGFTLDAEIETSLSQTCTGSLTFIKFSLPFLFSTT